MSKLLNCGFDVKITSGNISISPPNLTDVNLMKYQARCWKCQRWLMLPSWRLFCWRYTWSSSTGQLYNFVADLDHVLRQLVDILNALFNISLLSGQLTFATETRRVDSLFVNTGVQLLVHLKNLTFKFKMLNLLYHKSCSNEIYKTCCLNTHI